MVQVTERQYAAMRAVVDAAEALVQRETARVDGIVRRRLRFADSTAADDVARLRATILPAVLDPDLVDAVNALAAVRLDEPSALQI